MTRLFGLLSGGDHTCPAWLSLALDNPLRRLLHRPRAILSRWVSPGDRVLDLGAGSGYFTVPLARLVGPDGAVHAVDIQERMLEKLRRRAARHGCANIRTHRTTGAGLDLDGPFDFVLMFAMLHEVSDRERMLRDVRAVLADAGRVLLAEPIGHVRRPTFERELELAQASGLEPVASPRIAVSHAVVLAPGC